MLLKNNRIKYMCVYTHTRVTSDHFMLIKNCVQKTKVNISASNFFLSPLPCFTLDGSAFYPVA